MHRPATPITTAEELLDAGDIGRCELVRGELILMSPASGRHGLLAQHIAFPLDRFVRERGVGAILAAETGFILRRNPDTVRAPDAAFIRSEKLGDIPERGFIPFAPELAVEVLSPDDTASEVLDKVGEWLDAGTKMVWVADPRTKTVSVYQADRPALVLRIGDTLRGEAVLPGLAIPVAEIFA